MTVLDSLRGVDLIEVLRDRLGSSAASAPLALLKDNEKLATQSTLKDPWIIYDHIGSISILCTWL